MQTIELFLSGAHPLLPSNEKVLLTFATNKVIVSAPINRQMQKKLFLHQDDIADVVYEQVSARSASKAIAGAVIGGIATGGLGAIAGVLIGGRNHSKYHLDFIVNYNDRSFTLTFKSDKANMIAYDYLIKFLGDTSDYTLFNKIDKHFLETPELVDRNLYLDHMLASGELSRMQHNDIAFHYGLG
jgi:hypothetical protein